MVGARNNGTVVSEVAPDSPASRVGLRRGDRILTVNGVAPRDIIEWKRLVSEQTVELGVVRGDERFSASLNAIGEPLGLAVESALFDRVHTCDNHCDFCFIYQLPKGLRRTLYLKDDDYRLSFLFGNFTTLTRFTEADLERVEEERLSPLHVSVHTADPWRRADMLRNERGGMSLRWLRELLGRGVSVKAQIVLCPGVNDGEVLDATLASILESYPELDAIAIVPLGLSRFNPEPHLRVHTSFECAALIDQVGGWQDRFVSVLGRQPLFLSDEVYLTAGAPVPNAEHYGSYDMIEDGIGLVRSFTDSFEAVGPDVAGRSEGFFAEFDAPNPTSYTVAHNPAVDTGLRPASKSFSTSGVSSAPTGRTVILTGTYAAPVLREILDRNGYGSVEVRGVPNNFFGGNTAVAGLMTFSDLSTQLYDADDRTTFVLPDVCLNDGRFLDGPTIADLAGMATVEVVPTSGSALRTLLDSRVNADAESVS